MAISADNKRVVVTMPENLYKVIKEKADKENRSTSNMITTMLKQYLETIN